MRQQVAGVGEVGSDHPEMLLFVDVFGAGLTTGGGAGIGHGRAAYANNVAPTIALLTVIGRAQGTAIAVSTDVTEGIIASRPRPAAQRNPTRHCPNADRHTDALDRWQLRA